MRIAFLVLAATVAARCGGDDDSGEIARESMGTAKVIYVNVRNLGPGDSPVGFPVTFSAAEFGPPPPGPGSLCCKVTQATRDVAVSGERYSITLVSGGEDPPAQSVLDEANALLFSLRLEPYVPVAVPALPADATKIEGYGISMRLPRCWNGSVQRGELDAGSDDLRLQLLEHATIGGLVTGHVPIELTPAEFVPPTGGSDPSIAASSGRSFVEHGRDFVLRVDADAFPPSAAAVEQANEALATLRIEAGDFYPGTVAPATFAAEDGWYSGTNGTTDVQPDGEATWTWASTIPYLDEPGQFLPHKTLAALPPDGIVIYVQLVGPGHGTEIMRPPFQITQADGPLSFEGQPGGIAGYSLSGRVASKGYDVDMSVLFGREKPTPAQFARANAELARLELPDWPSVSG